MTETKRVQLNNYNENKHTNFHTFDIHDIKCNVENVIQVGLNKLLSNYIERHEMMETTCSQLLNLPYVAEELNHRKENSLLDDTDFDSEIHAEVHDWHRTEIPSRVEPQNSHLEKELTVMKKKYDEMLTTMKKNYDDLLPVLTKLVDKVVVLNELVQHLRNNQEVSKSVANPQQSTFEKTTENEHIKIKVEETVNTVVEEEVVQEVVEEETEVEEEDVEVVEEESEDVEEVVEEDVVEEDVIQEDVVEEDVVEESEEESEEVVEEDVEEVVEEDVVEEDVIQEDVVEEDVEEEEVEEESEEVLEDASIETETKEVLTSDDEEQQEIQQEIQEEIQEDEEDVFEIEIDDVTYCTNNEYNGFIWELTDEGEQGNKVGYLKDGEPFFYADEN